MIDDDLFFVRKAMERGEYPTVFQTENMSENLALQISEMLQTVLSKKLSDNAVMKYVTIRIKQNHPIVFTDYTIEDFIEYRLFHPRYAEYLLTYLEMTTKILKRDNPKYGRLFDYDPFYSVANLDEFTELVNARFRQNGYGYQMENAQIVNMDSTFIHSEAIKPTIQLLINESFLTPLQEFMSAFRAFKNSNYDETIRLCANAFESTMKEIYHKKGWDLPRVAQANIMINDLKDKGLFPAFLQGNLSHIVGTLTDGLPTLGNKTVRHGMGPAKMEIEIHFARYALNLVGTNMLFLIECYKRLPPEPVQATP